MRVFTALAVFSVLLLGLACSSSTDSSDRAVHYLDVSGYPIGNPDDYQLFVRVGWLDGYEPYVDGDINRGEPFTDNNGNGVYDPGIDWFIKSGDVSINQDLNHNGAYDGPNSTWAPGIPWVDLNGNGSFDPEDFRYDVGEPFADLNGDGIWEESIVDTQYYVTRCVRESLGGFTTGTAWEIMDSTHALVQQSNVTVVVPERSSYTWDSQHNRLMRVFGFTFRESPAGVFCVVEAAHFRDTLLLPLYDVADSVLSRSVVSAGWANDAHDSITCVRTVRMGGSLVTPFGNYTDCLYIQLSDLSTSEVDVDDWFSGKSITFWLHNPEGVVAILSDSIIHITGDVYLARRFDSLALPLSR